MVGTVRPQFAAEYPYPFTHLGERRRFSAVHRTRLVDAIAFITYFDAEQVAFTPGADRRQHRETVAYDAVEGELQETAQRDGVVPAERNGGRYDGGEVYAVFGLCIFGQREQKRVQIAAMHRERAKIVGDPSYGARGAGQQGAQTSDEFAEIGVVSAEAGQTIEAEIESEQRLSEIVMQKAGDLLAFFFLPDQLVQREAAEFVRDTAAGRGRG